MAITGEPPDPQPAEWDGEKSREVRLGIVMYGGISLAIYINGVAQELFRAVRGRSIYRLIKALTDSDIVVDVISGTSAGGINGVFLSYALCNDKDFSQFANLWREHGDINKLLREPDDEIPNASSFLDSEGYYQPRLEEAFRRMGDYDPEPGEDASEIRELDLFVTGTDIDGRVYTQFDDAGHPIDIKDHRAVFLLKHRAGRKEPFKPEPNPEVVHRALATLSRLTSCFPAAFAPVHVDLVAEGDDSADGLLQSWGKLGKEASFLDGGLLDNKPFTYTLKAIFSRTADREVDRKLFYVEPDPEVMRQADSASSPNFLQAVLAALIGIPGYESIADDLRLLADRNSKLQQYNRLVKEFKGGIVSDETRHLYRRSRLIALSERVVQGLFRQDGRNQQIPPEYRERAARLVRAFDNLPFDQERVFRDFDVHFRLRRLFRLVYLIYGRLYAESDEASAAPVTPELRESYRALWRALNRQLKLYEVLLAVMESLVDDAPIQWQDVREKKEEEVWTEVWMLIQDGYYRLLDDAGAAAQLIRAEDLERFLQGKRKDWLTQDDLRGIQAALGKVYDAILEEVRTAGRPEPAPEGTVSLLRRIDDCERRLLEHFVPDAADPVRQAYDTFEELDAHLFPLELVGNLHEKDIIETIRISPRDAARGFSAMDLPAKVAGDSVYHFGGFFKRSWRSNDILWGRLDGLCQLVESLLDRQRVAALMSWPADRQRIRERFLDGTGWRLALDPEALFPRSGERTHQELRKWLLALLGDDDNARGEALGRERFDAMVSLLVEAAQLEVIAEDLPNVVTDALQEQSDWNRFQTYETAKPERPQKIPVKSGEGQDETALAMLPWIFQAPDGRLDPLVTTAAAAWRTREAMLNLEMARTPPPRPAATFLGRFFRQSYRVGSERLIRDVPTLVLLEILAKVLLVARTCVLGLFGGEASRIRRSPLYRFCIDWPLRAFYALVGLARRSPGVGLGLFVGLGVVSLLALIVGILWWPYVVMPEGHLLRRGLATFIVAPAIILALEGTFLLWGGRWLTRRVGLLAFFAGLLSLVGLTVGILGRGLLLPPTTFLSRFGVAFLLVIPAAVLLLELLGLLVEARRRSASRRKEEKRGRLAERDRNLEALRQIAAQALETRFGPLPKEAQETLQAYRSVEKLGRLLAQSGTASARTLGFPELEPSTPGSSEAGSEGRDRPAA